MQEFINECENILSKNNFKSMGYFCTYTPVEIIYAAGFVPYRIKGADKPIQDADGYMHANICPYVRSCLDVALEEKVNHLEGTVFINSCDAMRRLYSVWQKYIPAKFTHFIDLPKRMDKIDVDFFNLEFEEFSKVLEQHFSLKISKENLEKSIMLFKEIRLLLKQLYELRKDKYELLKASNILKIMNYSVSVPPEEFIVLLSSLLERIKKSNSKSNSQPKVLLIGSIIHHESIIEIMESCGAAIISDDLCSGSRMFEFGDEIQNNTLKDLARAYLKKSPCGRMLATENNIKKINNLIDIYQIDGVIHYTLKFCDNILYNVPRIKSSLNNKGIKSLFIEGDYTSNSMGQIKTRVEAFIEILT